MTVSTTNRKPLGIRATPREHALIRKAAAKEGRSVNSFVLHAALEAAQELPHTKRRSQEEVRAIIQAAQKAVKEANPTNRDLLAEFLSERRADAVNG